MRSQAQRHLHNRAQGDMREERGRVKINAEIKHQDMIDILEETRKVLPDTEAWTPDHDKEGYGLQKARRGNWNPTNPRRNLLKRRPKRHRQATARSVYKARQIPKNPGPRD
ncbi:hypothetical protein BDZ97DRAFT_1759820 [Flammula alnicola]|nr:hypothetical protein BDZ97DRAFT_1759820 [Flammula alnicola]